MLNGSAGPTTFAQEGVSSKLGELLRNLSQGIGGVIISLVYSWDMTLLMLAASPIQIFAIWILQWATSTATTLIQVTAPELKKRKQHSLRSIRITSERRTVLARSEFTNN